MRFVSWKKIQSWNCLACGECCRKFNIPLRGDEYARILPIHGGNVFNYDKKPGHAYLKRREDGSCIFQSHFYNGGFCQIQGYKPLACKLFPFLISKTNKKRARFYYNGNYYNVFIDRNCNGLKYGTPDWKLVNVHIPEAIEMSLNPLKPLRKNTYKFNFMFK